MQVKVIERRGSMGSPTGWGSVTATAVEVWGSYEAVGGLACGGDVVEEGAEDESGTVECVASGMRTPR